MCDALQSQIGRLGLQATVRLVGHVDDMAAAYLAAHVTVIASTEPGSLRPHRHRGRGHGLPGDRHRYRGAARDGAGRAQRLQATPLRAGWCLRATSRPWPSDSSEALALAPDARAAMGARARRHVMAHFTVRGMQRRTLSVYDRLLGTRLERRFCDATAGHAPATELPGKP